LYQNLINNLTDRVSVLTATLDAERRYADAANAKRLVLAAAWEVELARADRAEAELIAFKSVTHASVAFEGRVLAEWLNAIRLEIETRGMNANMETCLHYAQEALSGREPHWLTSEYLNKTRDPRAHYQERFRNAD
jgi:hypothetical protein